jgi:hypothetical protein
MDRFSKTSEVGKPEDLQTTDKTNVVAAVNELDNEVTAIQTDNITVSIYKISNYATP